MLPKKKEKVYSPPAPKIGRPRVGEDNYEQEDNSKENNNNHYNRGTSYDLTHKNRPVYLPRPPPGPKKYPN